MERFERFQDRELNSHAPMIASYRRMLSVFEKEKESHQDGGRVRRQADHCAAEYAATPQLAQVSRQVRWPGQWPGAGAAHGRLPGASWLSRQNLSIPVVIKAIVHSDQANLDSAEIGCGAGRLRSALRPLDFQPHEANPRDRREEENEVGLVIQALSSGGWRGPGRRFSPRRPVASPGQGRGSRP
jgi:hypothetical protein